MRDGTTLDLACYVDGGYVCTVGSDGRLAIAKSDDINPRSIKNVREPPDPVGDAIDWLRKNVIGRETHPEAITAIHALIDFAEKARAEKP